MRCNSGSLRCEKLQNTKLDNHFQTMVLDQAKAALGESVDEDTGRPG